MKYGISYLAGNKYQQVVLDEHPQGWDAKIFATTFGDAYQFAQKLLATGRVERLWVQLLWSDNHSFGDKNIPELIKLSKKWNQLATRNRIALSPFCEHRLSNPDKYCDIVATHAPNCSVFNSPESATGKGAYSKKYLNDLHGSKSKLPATGLFTFDYDGEDAFGADIESHKKKFSGSETFFLWCPNFNLKYKLDDKTPRPKRKYRPLNKHVDAIVALHRDKGQTKLPKNWILKPVAEDTQGFTGKPDSKSNKVVFICPPNAKEIKLLAMTKNQVIDTAKNYGKFSDGKRYRYYTRQWGFEIAEKALRIGGDRRVRVFVNGKHVGTVNCAFRENGWR